jgi:hypothetical protein
MPFQLKYIPSLLQKPWVRYSILGLIVFLTISIVVSQTFELSLFSSGDDIIIRACRKCGSKCCRGSGRRDILSYWLRGVQALLTVKK